MKTTIGGDRLGSGNKQDVHLKNYERSTHDLSFAWRSSMSSGTIVPFLCKVALPADSWDIDLNCDIKTLPTIGPLFGSYKVQLDIFQIPIRLYQAQLHNNKIGIGMDMSKIKLPLIEMFANATEHNGEIDDNSQINPSSIYSYLGIRGLGMSQAPETSTEVFREFNAIPYIGYWDIVKNYYANKQEEIGAVIHNDMNGGGNALVEGFYISPEMVPMELSFPFPSIINMEVGSKVEYTYTNALGVGEEPDYTIPVLQYDGTIIPLYTMYTTQSWNNATKKITYSDFNASFAGSHSIKAPAQGLVTGDPSIQPPKIVTFPLENIDKLRENILANINSTSAFKINQDTIAPFGLSLKKGALDPYYCKLSTMEGLALKTYQSDLFNNWISTEWIDGNNGISAITAIDTSDGNFTLDTLNLSKKVYDMLNRIAISGGTYDDWLEANWVNGRQRAIETPMYLGGLSKEIVFQEVISQTQSEGQQGDQPLGTLAGRGVMSNKHKGGSVKVRVDEPSYIMGMVSITPRIDYSQGNDWTVNLKTMDDFHKPALDEIGYQDLITDQMHWADTRISPDTGNIVFKSAGKQPAWINYMTSVNEIRGNFAEKNDSMFMTLNRRYEVDPADGITDLTTYVDPSKFNHIFANTRIDAQNFWTQIGVGITKRGKISAKTIPNL